jgi:hypothetical protein
VKAPKAVWLRLAASLAVLAVFTIVLPMSAAASHAGMRQTKRYESASSLSGEKIGEPVSFRVPPRARSVRVAIVDDTGELFVVRAIVRGDIVPRESGCTYYLSGCTTPPHDVCAGHPRNVALARGARVLTVSPDAGYGPHETHFLVGGAGNGDPESCPSPLSFPTGGTITVVFSRSG